MKKLLVTLAAVLVSVSTFGQGTILFNNRVTGQVDAPVTVAGSGAGFGSVAGAQAQLFLVNNGVYTALTPATTFRTTSAAAMPYVQQPVQAVTVPGVAAGQQATVVLRAWAGAASFDAASQRGESQPITISLGGTPAVGAPIPDAFLTGLQGFAVTVPEPSTIALGLFGAAALLYRRRK